MDEFSQLSAQFSQMRNFVVNEALTTAQQVQAGVQQVQHSPPLATTNTGSNGIFWFGLGTITALVVGYYWWRRGR